MIGHMGSTTYTPAVLQLQRRAPISVLSEDLCYGLSTDDAMMVQSVLSPTSVYVSASHVLQEKP